MQVLTTHTWLYVAANDTQPVIKHRAVACHRDVHTAKMPRWHCHSSSPDPRPSPPPLPLLLLAYQVVNGTFKPAGRMMFEAVSFYGWLGLLLAVQSRPAIASIAADAASFQSYAGVSE